MNEKGEIDKFFNLILDIWQEASKMTSTFRMHATKPSLSFIDDLEKNYALDNIAELTNYLSQIYPIKAGRETEKRGKILEILRQFDLIFYRIHPRALTIAPKGFNRPIVPEWLDYLRSKKNMDGVYWENDHFKFVPRGPLKRKERGRFASSAECLEDRFTAISILPKSVLQDGRAIKVVNKIIGFESHRGIPLQHHTGNEIVSFFPIARNSNDLQMEVKSKPELSLISISSHPDRELSEIVVQGISKIGNAEIIISPEFIISEAQSIEINNKLKSLNSEFGMYIAGTGNTNTSEEGLPWNESRVVNKHGKILWTQRKVWPAGIKKDKAHNFGLEPFEAEITNEENVNGTEVVIADSDALGRCIILICQDITGSMAEELIRQYQPDWVFIPIFDHAINSGGWAHQRTLSLSNASHARFLIVNNTAFQKPTNLNVGLALGPMQETDTDDGRIVQLVQLDKDSNMEFCTIQWREGTWSKSELGTTHI